MRAAQQYGELAAQHDSVPPLCCVPMCRRVETLPLYPVLVHMGRSNPGLPGANEPYAAKGQPHLGSGSKQFVVRAVVKAMARSSTLRDKRGMALRRRG